ncbi:4-hydroxy-2-oxoheptanedioate aldolase [Paenochrobactrum gallinarii]|uniref:4-hydroxy-2-oxoheptanedioate aldolase n=1 Tax=Paenochrobactrum gallinarii TaxID=643673 RepID=A0A841LW46_9HYPH|nr:HpcH/HpaI aldolase/citrate lyase family protein [Paenochrobactrum gallinarii]MBB6262585.1 4-hydroxy-2-oxoheptanedioate aldolase [Paenochrobactrum gallinarii]
MSISAPRNDFKKRLLRGEALHGLWLSMASPVASEALSLVGFDWLLFDTEHAAIDLASVQPLLQAAAVGNAHAVVRPAWNDKVLIKRALDMGAQTLLIPFVETAAEAAAAVEASRYPPHGVRGVAGGTRASRFGLAPDHFQVADQEVCILVQLETMAALDRLEEIAAIPGVDGIFIGPSDLSASMGFLGQATAPEVQDVLAKTAGRIYACGKASGILATNGELAKRYLDWGYNFVAGAVELGLMLKASQGLLADMRTTKS